MLHQKVTIKGHKNIICNAQPVEIGIKPVGFMHKNDITLLNVVGKLKFEGNFSIGRGCRLDIGKEAVVTIKAGGYINCNTNLIIMHKLTIGSNCAISWNCQFLDEDFHQIKYNNKQETDNGIVIGNNVWIGCNVKIYKGTIIPDGCVIASDSVVKGVFFVKNSLIGGYPAKVIKENIEWK